MTVQSGGTAIATSFSAVTGTVYAGTFGNAGTSRFFQRGSVSTDDSLTSVFSINNVQLGLPADTEQVFEDCREAFNLGSDNNTALNPRIRNLSDFALSHFVHPVRLNFNLDERSPDNVRCLSGLDSRDASLSILWTTTGASANSLSVTPVIFVSQTSVLRVSAGRVCDLIQ